MYALWNSNFELRRTLLVCPNVLFYLFVCTSLFGLSWLCLLPFTVQHTQHKNIYAPGGIRTRNPSKRSAADPRLRPLGHWDWQRTQQWVNTGYDLHRSHYQSWAGDSEWHTSKNWWRLIHFWLEIKQTCWCLWLICVWREWLSWAEERETPQMHKYRTNTNDSYYNRDFTWRHFRFVSFNISDRSVCNLESWRI